MLPSFTHPRLLCALTLLGALAFAAPAWPARGGGEAKSAFLFADRKNWRDALGHAQRSRDPALIDTITWLYLQDPDGHAPFGDITRFIARHPDWPRLDKLRLRAEQSLRSSDAPDKAVSDWFSHNPPVSGIGKMKQAELLMRAGASPGDEQVQYLLRDAWRNGDFEEPEEKHFLAAYGSVLRAQDHITRADRLLWEEKTKPAQRMLDLLPPAQAALAQARISMIENSMEAPFRLARVPPQLKEDPGLVYNRLQWRMRRGDDDGARALLQSTPAVVPYPDKWWKLREQEVRRAIAQGAYREARRLLDNHAQTDGKPLIEAEWLSGWLSLEFLHDAPDAYRQFYRMYNEAEHATSKARAAYWAARAAERTADTEGGRSWYATASAYPTTFYGQLAAFHLRGSAPLTLPAEPPVGAEDRKHFDNSEMARAARIASDAGALDTATALLYHLVDTAKTASQAELAAQLAQRMHEALGVRAAKRAMQRNFLVLAPGYPKARLPEGLPVEPALAEAVARQESEFDPHAKSPAGALGMMQITPSTARDIARKAALRYHPGQLSDQRYNIQLGSAYLARLVRGYDGSYVLAIAAYNAGPGNVRNWLDALGKPGGEVDGAVDWIERIPFSETRNYVQRVMENMEVYRHLMAGKTPPKLQIADDLTRGNGR